MFKVSNKLESYQLIEKLGLNKLPEVLVEEYDEKKINNFLKKYPAKSYAVRDREKKGSKLFNLNVKREDILDYVKGQRMFTINVNTASLPAKQLLTGEILVKTNGDVVLAVSKNPSFSARDGALRTDYQFSSDVTDKRLDRISGLGYVLDYIYEKELFDVIVEFACFDGLVGTKGGHVAIFELRTDY